MDILQQQDKTWSKDIKLYIKQQSSFKKCNISIQGRCIFSFSVCTRFDWWKNEEIYTPH